MAYSNNSGGSLREVLLRAHHRSSPPGSLNSRSENTGKALSTAATGLNFAGVTWKSVKTASLEAELLQHGRGQYFPAKLALGLGMAKILIGLFIIAFGILAVLERAAYSHIGSGMWAGAAIIVCGFLGLMAGKNHRNAVYVVSFLVTSLLELAVVALMLVFTTTGLLKDSDSPMAYFVDEEDNGKPIEFLGKIPLRQRAVIVSAVLVAFGTVDVLLSLASIAICAREACFCYGPNPSIIGSHANLLEIDMSPEGRAKADRLAKWLRQQTRFQQAHSPRFVPPAHTICQSVPPLQFAPPFSVPQRHLPRPLMPVQYLRPYAPCQPCQMAQRAVPSVDYETQSCAEQKKKKKRRPSKLQRVVSPSLSDSLSQTYTGLDRDIAEEFIQQTMDPSRSLTVRNIVLAPTDWSSCAEYEA